MMAISSELLGKCPGLVYFSHPKLPSKIQRCNGIRFSRYNALPLVSERIPRGRIQYLLANRSGTNHVTYVGSNHQLSFEDNLPEEPFWLSLIKEAIWALRSLFAFLIEQPSQLKYIEWPSFQSTLKTATLTLVLVALLIVALSSVDSALCYVLALLLRRTP